MDLQPSRRRAQGPCSWYQIMPPGPECSRVLALWQPPMTAPTPPTPCRAEEGRCDNWPGFLNLEKKRLRGVKGLSYGHIYEQFRDQASCSLGCGLCPGWGQEDVKAVS